MPVTTDGLGSSVVASSWMAVSPGSNRLRVLLVTAASTTSWRPARYAAELSTTAGRRFDLATSAHGQAIQVSPHVLECLPDSIHVILEGRGSVGITKKLFDVGELRAESQNRLAGFVHGSL